MRLQSKAAIVTDGGLGIGRGIARIFAREGARVLIMDVDDAAGDRTVAEISAADGTARFLHGDITGQALAVDGGMTSQLQADLAGRFARLINERPEILDAMTR